MNKSKLINIALAFFLFYGISIQQPVFARDSTSISSVSVTGMKRCCTTFLGGTALSTSASANSYSTHDVIYNCPPGYVGTAVRADPNTPVYGVYCMKIGSICTWVKESDTSATYTTTILYWNSGWNSLPYTFTSSC